MWISKKLCSVPYLEYVISVLLQLQFLVCTYAAPKILIQIVITCLVIIYFFTAMKYSSEYYYEDCDLLRVKTHAIRIV